MLSAFIPQPRGLERREIPEQEPLPQESLWLDLLEPSVGEEKRVEEFLAIDVPTREEMREIETSNRLYEEDGALYMTATVITKLDTEIPENAQITFILSGNRRGKSDEEGIANTVACLNQLKKHAEFVRGA